MFVLVDKAFVNQWVVLNFYSLRGNQNHSLEISYELQKLLVSPIILWRSRESCFPSGVPRISHILLSEAVVHLWRIPFALKKGLRKIPENYITNKILNAFLEVSYTPLE